MSMPHDPYPAGPPTSEVPPREVDASFWLWVAGFVLGLLGLLYFATEYDTIRDTALEQARNQLRGQRAALNQQQLETITTLALVGGIVVALALDTLQLVLAFLMRKGRNWARIVLAVFGALSVLSGLGSMSSESGVQAVLSVISLLVLLGALVTMFLPGANPWFRPRPTY
jgi:hypothetical protein